MRASDELKYQLEHDMKVANSGYAVWCDTSFGSMGSPAKIVKLKSFASKRLLGALEQGVVVIIMESEYSRPHFEFAYSETHRNA